MSDKPIEQKSTSQKNEKNDFFPVPAMEIRIRPAAFARMVNVSRQTVSQWIKRGVITLGPDGRLEPKEAASQVIRNTDPARLRAKVLKPLVDDVGALRRQLSERDEQVAYLDSFSNNLICCHERLLELIGQNWDTLRELESDAIVSALQELDDRASLECGSKNSQDYPDTDEKT